MRAEVLRFLNRQFGGRHSKVVCDRPTVKLCMDLHAAGIRHHRYTGIGCKCNEEAS